MCASAGDASNGLHDLLDILHPIFWPQKTHPSSSARDERCRRHAADARLAATRARGGLESGGPGAAVRDARGTVRARRCVSAGSCVFNRI